MSDITTERLVLSGLVLSDSFINASLPFVQEEYFHSRAEQAVFQVIKKYLDQYGAPPKQNALIIDLKNHENLNSRDTTHAIAVAEDIYSINVCELDPKWLLDQCESFCQSKAIYNAIQKTIAIYDGTEDKLTPQAIPDLLKDAVGISFDTQIGMDYYDDAEERHAYYNDPVNKVPFDIDILNKITNGGPTKKTLNVLVAGINVGKTLGMCHLAAGYIKMGLNVLYISMEMAEEEICKRVDANILRTNLSELAAMPRAAFVSKLQSIKEKTHGQLKVKEFPPGTANTAHFKHLLAELKMKQRFTPDVIMIDYIGITGSSRMKIGVQSSYFYLKAVAEELRALAVETETVMWTAMQVTRGGMESSDVDITDVAESMGIPATADLMISMNRTDVLDSMNQLMCKQLKNRFANKTSIPRFVIGVDLERQTLYEVNQSEQNLIDATVSKGTGGVTKTTNLKEKFAKLKV